MPSRPRLILLLALFLFGFLLPNVTYGQEPAKKPAARKYEEFGLENLSYTKLILDGFAIELQNNPDAKGYVIVYRSRRDLPGLSARLVDRIRKYLVYTRGFTSDRIVAVDAGPAINLMQELWVAPPGTTPPIRNDAYSIVVPDRTAVRQFDEYYYFLSELGLDEPQEPGGGDEYPGGSLHAFAAALAEEPNASAYVIAYPEYRIETEPDERNRKVRRVYLDRPNIAARMLKGVRTELVKEQGVADSRVKTVNGGYRRQRSVELWIVPAGEHPPIATPNAFPPKRTAKPKNSNHSAAQVFGMSTVDRLSAVSVVPGRGSQAEPGVQNRPRKFDEYGDVKSSDAKARLDNFAIEMQNHPELTGYIRVFRRPRGLPGWTANRISWMKGYLVNSRGVPADRLVALDGGAASNVAYESWLAGPNATLPDRADAIHLATDLIAVRKYDDYYYPLLPGDWGESDIEGESLPGFFAALQQELRSTAYVIAYPQYSVASWHDRKGRAVRRVHQDPASTASKMLASVRTELLNNGLSANRIRLINGGYRKQRSVELWIVPAGQHPPIATPNAFPPKRRASRKNHAEQSRIPSARKFDEFGILDLAAVRQRLDRFAAELTRRPSDHGFVMFYRARTDLNGVSARWTEGAVDYLRRIKGIEHLRLMGHAPGAVDTAAMELWIGPRDAYPDIRKPVDAGTLPDPRRTRKFDEYYYNLTDDGDTEADARSRAMRLAGDSIPTFAALRSAVPDSLAYVIVYPEYRAGTRQLDPPETADRMLGAISAELTEGYNLDPSLMRLMNGGYRKQRTVELWLVPRGKRPPTPTPNAFPRKQKTRYESSVSSWPKFIGKELNRR